VQLIVQPGFCSTCSTPKGVLIGRVRDGQCTWTIHPFERSAKTSDRSTSDRMLFVKLLTAAYVALLFSPFAFSQVNQTDCKSLVLQSGLTQVHEPQPQKGEKYRRPPMVAYEVQEDSGIRGLRLVRRSGVKELDQELLAAASNWKYQARPGCGSVKVPLAAGSIPDKTTALKVAEPELIRIYGERIIRSEQPLDAGVSGDTWIVNGTLHCSDGKGGRTSICLGGVATAHLSKSDGRVLQIFHTQ